MGWADKLQKIYPNVCLLVCVCVCVCVCVFPPLCGHDEAVTEKEKEEIVCVRVCVVPNVQENQLSRAIHVGLICQPFEEVGERGSKLLAALTRSRRKEEHQDAVLQAHDDLTLCVQLILVLVVLHQDAV